MKPVYKYLEEPEALILHRGSRLGMSPNIRRMIWGAFIGVAVLTAASVALTIAVLQMEQRNEFLIVRSRPMLDAVRKMDESLLVMVSSTRGYLMTKEGSFVQQYDDAVRTFETKKELAGQQDPNPRDQQTLDNLFGHYKDLKALTDKQIRLIKEGKTDEAQDLMLETARMRAAAPDYEDLFTERLRADQAVRFERLGSVRQWVMMAMIFLGLGLIVAAALVATRIEAQFLKSLNREVRRTEAMIAGMSDGVLLVDGEGRHRLHQPRRPAPARDVRGRRADHETGRGLSAA